MRWKAIPKIILAGAFLISLAQCKSKEPAEEMESLEFHPKRTARVEKSPRDLEVAGTVRAGDVAELASRFGGFVREMRVTAGNRIKKGELLVLLDDRSLEAQSSKARFAENEVREAIEEAAHHLEAAAAEKELAINTFNRINGLYQRQSASKQEFEEARTRKVSAEEAWKSAQKRKAQSESKLRQVQSDSQDVASSLNYQRIHAPFDGIVTTVTADEGAFVNPGQVLITVENTSNYQMLFYLEQGFVPVIGSTIEIQIPGISDKQFASAVEESSPSPDTGTKTYLVKSSIPKLPGLHSGLTGKVFLKVPDMTLWIPLEFLKSENDLETVFVRHENAWERVLIKSGKQSGRKVEILSGLSEGEEIGL